MFQGGTPKIDSDLRVNRRLGPLIGWVTVPFSSGVTLISGPVRGMVTLGLRGNGTPLPPHPPYDLGLVDLLTVSQTKINKASSSTQLLLLLQPVLLYPLHNTYRTNHQNVSPNQDEGAQVLTLDKPRTLTD